MPIEHDPSPAGNPRAGGDAAVAARIDLTAYDLQDLLLAARHLEDLAIFAGQRSRLHPEPGWAPVLLILAGDLEMVRAELDRRRHPRNR